MVGAPQNYLAVIKVIGVGGGGVNASRQRGDGVWLLRRGFRRRADFRQLGVLLLEAQLNHGLLEELGGQEHRLIRVQWDVFGLILIYVQLIAWWTVQNLRYPVYVVLPALFSQHLRLVKLPNLAEKAREHVLEVLLLLR